MTAALGADRASEIARALDAVVDIAADRYAKLTTQAPEGATR
jgi:2-oxo-4-hydroxy-4-carboxy--5-ureidoimidazoline (OHCU) decarboxylase